MKFQVCTIVLAGLMTGCGVKQATSIEPGTTDENSALNDSLTSPENENNSNNNEDKDSESLENKSEDNNMSEGIDGVDDINDFKLDEKFINPNTENQDSESILQNKNLNIIDKDYKIFTNRFDEIAKAENLETVDEILKLRKNLDQQLISFQDLINNLLHLHLLQFLFFQD